MKTLRTYNKKTLLGIVDGQNIYLTSPSWDCGWYWGFGYLGNNNCHYHVDGLKKIETYNFEKKVREYEFVDLHEGFIRHFGKSFVVRKSNIWEFAELFQTFYKLKETCEVLGKGGAHLSNNPCSEIIKNTEEVKRINEIVLPAIFDAIYKILDQNANNQNLFAELVKLNNEGDTKQTVKFMFKNAIYTDDLKGIEGITDHDFNILHTEYWRQIHAKK